ncbi:hypothetical protein C8R45DRAFT_1185010 [Mycena sanguinolenta]|nr:hypothetical protein C8R45DRAFT_1185010 [Mycena sanguinolenta]
MSNRKSVRTAAIAASVVSAVVVCSLGVIFFRILRRRLRMRERIPEQFIDSQEHIVQIPGAKTVDVSAGLESNQPEVDLSVLDDAEMKQAVQMRSPRDNSADALLPDRLVVVPEESAVAPSDPQQAEETVTLRLRRVEERLDSLFAFRSPESSPPSYCG